MGRPAFDCYSCDASVPDRGAWPPGWAICVGFRAGCPDCLAAGRAIPLAPTTPIAPAVTDEYIAV